MSLGTSSSVRTGTTEITLKFMNKILSETLLV